jgi:hypothetical protein
VSLTSEGLKEKGVIGSRISGEPNSDNVSYVSFRLDTRCGLSKPGKYTLIVLGTVGIANTSVDLAGNPAVFTRLP